MNDVLFVGAGPVGLTMAAELIRHGTSCRIIDRLHKPNQYCRAIGVTQRTLEVWENMGVVDAMMDAGIWLQKFRLIVDGKLSPRCLRISTGCLIRPHWGCPNTSWNAS